MQRHRLRYVQFVQEENQGHVPRRVRLLPDDRDAPFSRARRHILPLESMSSVLHADLFKVRAQLQVLLTEHGSTPSAPTRMQHG